jgi:hypothetical protein
MSGITSPMATKKQQQAAKRNVRKAQSAATSKRTIANLPKSTRSELGKQAARGRRRGGEAGHSLEDRNRQQLYELARERDIPGRSKMGKWELIEALRSRS